MVGLTEQDWKKVIPLIFFQGLIVDLLCVAYYVLVITEVLIAGKQSNHQNWVTSIHSVNRQ